MPPASREEYSDQDSSCSSIATRDSSLGGWISDFSFGSSASSSAASDCTLSAATGSKPHKANQTHWQAMRLVRRRSGPIGLHHFHLLRRLGSGDIGNVYLCRLRSAAAAAAAQCLYAMKVVDREALAARKKLVRAEMEKEILSLLDHPFLPTLYAHFDVSHYSCLVMEFCPGGDLHAVRQRLPRRRFSLSSTKFYAAETVVALEYLHMMGVVYRDLKPENVLVREDGHIMLSDFDLAFRCEVAPKLLRDCRRPPSPASSCVGPLPPVLSCFSAKRSRKPGQEEVVEAELVAEPINSRSKSFVGTHEYLAPEVIAGAGHGGAVDWWTLGVFLFELLYGTTPFKGENNERTLVNIIKQPLTFPKVGQLKSRTEAEELARAQDLISKLLVKNPKKRLGGLKGSAEIKKHEFFRGLNWALIRSVNPPEIPRDLEKMRRKAAVRRVNREREATTHELPQHFEFF